MQASFTTSWVLPILRFSQLWLHVVEYEPNGVFVHAEDVVIPEFGGISSTPHVVFTLVFSGANALVDVILFLYKGFYLDIQ